MSYPDFLLRGADEFDLPFLEQMFFAAADWNPATAHGEEHWRADPMLEKYLGGWKRHGDVERPRPHAHAGGG